MFTGSAQHRAAMMLAAMGGLAGTETTPIEIHSAMNPFRSGTQGKRSRIPGEQKTVDDFEKGQYWQGRYFATPGGYLLRKIKKLTGSCPRGYDIRHW